MVIAYPTIISSVPAVERFGYFPLKPFGWQESNIVALVLDLRREQQEIFSGFDESTRRYIRRCEREGATIQEVKDLETWRRCYPLNVQTLGEACYSDTWLDFVWREFIEPGLAVSIAVIQHGQVVSVATAVRWGTVGYYWLGFNAQPPVRGANSLALWSAISLLKDLGVTDFEIGSLEFGSEEQQGIGEFKARFRGRPVYQLSGTLRMKPVKHALLETLTSLIHSPRGSQPDPSDHT